MRSCIFCCIVTATSLTGIACGPSGGPAAEFSPIVPDGLGVNIHFTDPRPGEMKMLAAAGVRWVRMDFVWGRIERKKGQYDFSPYDRLLAAAKPHGIRFLFILDYSNKLYETDRSVRTAEGRRAMARWAAAAVTRYKGRGILWEMWNEPNISVFWKPKPNVSDYAALTKAVGEAIRKAAPEEAYIGPATSTIPLDFLEGCFKAGLLEYWTAVSVHPYRQQPPETAAADYARLRRLIDRYAPKGKQIEILSGEWGYSSVWGGMNDRKQGKMLPRQWLTNLANDVPISIWYDWHDDGPNPKEAEHHFGIVKHAYHAGRDPVYDPKDAYHAAKTLTTVLGGYRFNKRLAVGGAGSHVLLFTKGKDVRLAAWTTDRKPRRAIVPASGGRFTVTGHLGKALPPLTAGKNGLAVTLTDAPQYLAPDKPNDLLRVAAAWQRAPLEIAMPASRDAGLTLRLSNPLSRTIRVESRPGVSIEISPGGSASLTHRFELLRTAEPVPMTLAWRIEGLGRIAQHTRVVATNPLRVTALPPTDKAVLVRVENPSGEAFEGALRLTDAEGVSGGVARAPLLLRAGQREKVVGFARAGGAGRCRFGVRIEDRSGSVQFRLPPAALEAVDDFSRYTSASLAQAYAIVPDGDPKVRSTQAVSAAAPPDGPPAPGAGCLKIAYDFDDGWKFVRLAPKTDALRTIEGKPRALGMWIHADGTGNVVRLRFRDASGQTFQPNGEQMEWKGWRYVVFPMDGSRAGHWGGANDGAIHYPIRWDTLLLIDSAGQRKTRGEVHVAAATLIR